MIEKLAKAARKFATLESDLAALKMDTSSSASSSLRRRSIATVLKRKAAKEGSNPSPHKSSQDIKLAFSEFYLSLVLLQNYQTLNFTGFRKIMKKHDKVRWSSSSVEVLIICFFFIHTDNFVE